MLVAIASTSGCPVLTLKARQVDAAHAPPKQSWPHEPQLATSVLVSTQAVPQAVSGALHTHEPALHTEPFWHAPAQHGVPGTPQVGVPPSPLDDPPLELEEDDDAPELDDDAPLDDALVEVEVGSSPTQDAAAGKRAAQVKRGTAKAKMRRIQ